MLDADQVNGIVETAQVVVERWHAGLARPNQRGPSGDTNHPTSCGDRFDLGVGNVTRVGDHCFGVGVRSDQRGASDFTGF